VSIEEDSSKRCRPVRHTTARRVSKRLAACIIGQARLDGVFHMFRMEKSRAKTIESKNEGSQKLLMLTNRFESKNTSLGSLQMMMRLIVLETVVAVFIFIR